MNIRRFLGTLCCLLFAVPAGWAQPQAAPVQPLTASASDADFLQAADMVLVEVSKLLSLPVREPLKKSVRSREQIRDYLIRSMQDDEDSAKRYADRKALEAFGLIPKGYPLDEKLLALLTEQIAGLYDPKNREFFIADWNSAADERVIMAHELTHALQDQHFGIQQWADAAEPNDDAGLAREAVLEGSATVAMIDYLLRDTGTSSRDIPDLDPSLLLGDPSTSPELAEVPLVIRDALLFPYLAGSSFIQRVLKAWNGWPDLHKLFDHPPVSTQQILHPDLYLRGVAPQTVSLVPLLKAVLREWKMLDENIVGELMLHIILKKFLGEDRTNELAPSWAGDRYAVYEQRSGGRVLLVFRLRLASDAGAAGFFEGYSQVLEQKHEGRTALFRRLNFFSFETPEGGVFLRCFGAECLVAEGTSAEVFAAMTASIGWPAPSVDFPRLARKRFGAAGRDRSIRANPWIPPGEAANSGAFLAVR